MAPTERDDPRRVTVARDLLGKEAEQGLPGKRIRDRLVEPLLAPRLPLCEPQPERRDQPRVATRVVVVLVPEHAAGHERIGFVAGHAYALPTREKTLGHLDALRSAELRDGLVAHSDFTVGGGREALRELLAKPDDTRPTAVICSSDLMAIGAMQEADAQGRRVPDDISIVGFDGIDAASWTNPPLTTVEQPIDEIARTAVEALRGQVERPDERQPSYVFRPRLRPGGTTASPSSARATS